MKRWTQVFLILSLSAMISGCFQGGAGGQGRVPKVLEVGKSYTLSISWGGRGSFRVLEIDREAGWIKVDGGKGLSLNTWVNLSHILSIEPGAQQ